MAEFVQRLSTTRNALIALVIFVVFSVVWFNFGPVNGMVELADGAQLLDNTPGYTPADATTRLDSYGNNGRIIYRQFLFVDYLYGAVFAVTGLLVLSRLWRVIVGERVWLTWLFVAVMAFSFALEISENSLMLAVLAAYPHGVDGLLAATSMITSLKFAVVNVITIAVVASAGLTLAVTLYRQLSQKSTT